MTIEQALREAEYMDLAGLTAQDLDMPDDWHPLDDVQPRDEAEAAEIKFLRSHRHEWNDDQRCRHCAADGLA